MLASHAYLLRYLFVFKSTYLAHVAFSNRENDLDVEIVCFAFCENSFASSLERKTLHISCMMNYEHCSAIGSGCWYNLLLVEIISISTIADSIPACNRCKNSAMRRRVCANDDAQEPPRLGPFRYFVNPRESAENKWSCRVFTWCWMLFSGSDREFRWL